MFVHPLEERPLTITEAKIISSFPPTFRMVGDYRSKWARLANSVPPLMMKVIAEHIRDNILTGGQVMRG